MSYDNAPMYEARRHSSASFLLFSAGALVGAAAALVLAPANGRDTRAYIGERSRALAGTVALRGRQVWSEHGERVAEAVREGYAHAAVRLAKLANGALESRTGR